MSATAVLNLSKAGFTDEQVTALAEYFDPQMATKADIAELKRDIEQIRADLGRDIAAVRGDVDLKISGVAVTIAEVKAETIKWVAGLLIAQGAAVVALIRFLPEMH
ncbi:MAG: hypothetical protein WB697_06985 [Stellaceae bacterium]